MALPEQIRKQTEAVQQLYAQLNADDNTGADNPTDGTVAVDDAGDNTLAADEAVTTDNAAPPPADEQKTGDDNVSEETVLQKYKTLQGMYNAEVPRLHQQNRDMQNRLQQMEQLLASLSAQQETSAAQPPVAKTLISEKDIEEYGDSLDVMRKVSQEELSPFEQRLAQMETLLRQMQSSVLPQVQAVAQRQQVSAEQQFWADLATTVPNYREVNATEGFQAWLLEADPLTGITRQTYLDDAQRALDAQRVGNFFRAWLETTGQAAVAQSTDRGTSSELEKQVAPGRSRGAGSPAANNKAATYSPQDIQKFFNDVRMGKYKGREADRSRIERDIFNAQREGRIVMNA
jgi:hypothetical protein